MGGRTGSPGQHWTKKREREEKIILLAAKLGANKNDVLSLMREAKMTMHMMESIQIILLQITNAQIKS